MSAAYVERLCASETCVVRYSSLGIRLEQWTHWLRFGLGINRGQPKKVFRKLHANNTMVTLYEFNIHILTYIVDSGTLIWLHNPLHFCRTRVTVRHGAHSGSFKFDICKSTVCAASPSMSHDDRICNENLLCQRALVLWSDIWLETVRADEHNAIRVCSGYVELLLWLY